MFIGADLYSSLVEVLVPRLSTLNLLSVYRSCLKVPPFSELQVHLKESR